MGDRISRSGFFLVSPPGPGGSGTEEGMIMSTNTKGRERPGTVFTLGVLLSTLGVAAVGLLCCGVPLLVVAGGALGAAGTVAGSPWMMVAAAGVASVLIIRALRRRCAGNANPGSDCCGPTEANRESFRMHQEGPDKAPGVPEQPHVTQCTVVGDRDVRCCA